jgi:hypothetical protein
MYAKESTFYINTYIHTYINALFLYNGVFMYVKGLILYRKYIHTYINALFIYPGVFMYAKE